MKMKLDVLNNKYIKLILIVLILLIGTLDAFKFIPITPFSGILCFVATIIFFAAIISIINRIRKSSTLSFFKKLLVVVGVLEITVFQFGSYHLLFGDYEQQTLSMEQAYTENFDLGTNKNTESGNTVIEFKDVNVPIGTITINAESNKRADVKVDISISDDTHSADYRNNIANATVIKDNERSSTVPCNFSGKVHDIKFRFSTENEEYVTISEIQINKPITFHVSLLRCLIFIAFGMGVYMLARHPFLKKSFSDNRKALYRIAFCFTAVLIVATLFLANISRFCDENHSLASDFTMTYGNQINEELVDAFRDGHTYLNAEVNENLLALENPYDDSQRRTGDIGGYAWDHLLFNGKYYSYYGIGPVLTLFLPYNLITGYYFPSVWAVWLFGAIGIIFLTGIYLCFMDKFFGKVRSSLILSGLVIMQMATGVWVTFHTPYFYEIAQNSGFAFVTSGAYFLLRSNVIGDGKISKWRLALSSVLLGLAVMCRATTAVYCICALIFIYAGFKKLRDSNEKSQGISKKDYISYFLCALLPYAVIGSAQMYYNYVRFGSPLDFGIQYSLTINDFTQAEYHTHFVLITLFNYLFAIPKFIPRFPFFDFGTVETFNPQGYYFIATGTVCGLLWKAFPILSFAKAGTAYRELKSKNKKLYAVMFLAVSVAAPFVVMFSIWESGYCARYSMDFAWQMTIGALAIAFTLYQKCAKNTKKHLNALMTFSTIVSVILVFGQTYSWIINSMSVDWKANALSFARLFEFWI